VRKAKFSDKLEKCKLLAKNEGDKESWEVLGIANQLRNTIGHSLSTERARAKQAE